MNIEELDKLFIKKKKLQYKQKKENTTRRDNEYRRVR